MATLMETHVENKVEQTLTTARRKFTAVEYHLMGEAGILRPDERVELIEGEILKTSPKGTKRSASTTYAADCFRKHLA
jgi:hypothetical protein